MTKETANKYFGRKSFRNPRPYQMKTDLAASTRLVVIARLLGGKAQGSRTVVANAELKNASLETVVKVNPETKEVICKIKATANPKNGEPRVQENMFKTKNITGYVKFARSVISRQVAVLEALKFSSASKMAEELAKKSTLNYRIEAANKIIRKFPTAGLEELEPFSGTNVTGRPKFEGASIISPWSDNSTDTEPKTRIEETAATTSLVNPLLDLIPEKMSPDTPPLSPKSRKPMIEAKVGPAGGPLTRVWISVDERVCLPRLAKKVN